MQTQSSLNEMVMDGMHAHLIQAVEKRLERIRTKRCWQHDNIGSAEVKRLMRRTRAAHIVRLQELVQNLHHPPSQPFNRRELSDIHTRELLGQGRFITSKQAPVSEVVRKTLPDKVMFLQGAEGVLKNAVVGNCLQ